jgi:cell division protein FtsI (penicillin-binding protein 3)
MKVDDKKWIRVRIYLVAFFFLCGLMVLLLRAYQIQVLEKDKLEAIARAGYNTVVKLPPQRGTIYDREGRELAASVEVGSIYADPNLIESDVETARKLASKLDMSQDSILPLLKKDRSFVWIKRRLSPDKINQVKTLGLKGVGFVSETKRYYPGMDIAGHLLGIVGLDNDGLEGLEKKYDKVLTGPQQTLVQMRDALGRPFLITNPEGDNQDLNNLILTIDRDLQYKAQQTLEDALKKAGGKSGQCLIMDPETGEILAMAVVPSFNPNIFTQYTPDQWRNRTITDLYEPGSTIKAFLLAAALDKDIVTPDTEFYCEEGEYLIDNHTIHDTKEYKTLSVSDIVVLSSNIGALKLGMQLGYGEFYEYLRRFGFGEKTEIDLIGERQGKVRAPESSRMLDQLTVFFGQGMSVTSLQLVNGMASIANGGRLMKPYLVKAMMDQSGRVVKKFYPRTVRRVLSEDTAEEVKGILEKVVSERGTAPLAAIKGYRVAGKTGTSQKVDAVTKSYSKEDYISIFLGFVPVKDPKLVMLVMIDEPKSSPYGGVVAGPVFREVGKWALNDMRVNPDLKLVETIEEPIYGNSETPKDRSKRGIRTESDHMIPDFTGQTMREVLRLGSELGLEMVLDGSGMAVKQVPEPGSPIDGVTAVVVSFEPPV